MSLINDMLRDLDHRRDRKPQSGLTAPAVALGGKDYRQHLLLILGSLLFIAIIGGLILLILTPAKDLHSLSDQIAGGTTPRESKVSVESVQHKAPVVTRAQVMGKSVIDSGVELSALTLVTRGEGVVFTLHFSAPPEYQLEQGLTGNTRLVIVFPKGVVGRQLVIPDIETDSLIKEFSLKPGNQSLKLLVDLNHAGGIDSVQTSNEAHSDYLLQIAIKRLSGNKNSQKETSTGIAVPQNDATKTDPPLPKSAPLNHIESTTAHGKVGKSSVRTDPGVSSYNLGLQQLTQGQVAQAKESFYRALAEQPGLINVRVQLISLLQKQQQPQEAQQLLRQGLSLFPEEPLLRKLQARQLLASRSYSQGIDVLSAQPMPHLNKDTEYYALLAVLFHDAGKYQSAGEIYQQLVNVQPHNPTWWFGLALCADQERDSSVARQAYQTALTLPTLRADLQIYARQRLQQF